MNILIITSLYPDDSPVKTTNAVHELVRFWTKEHKVVCFKEEWVPIVLRKKKLDLRKETGSAVGKKGFLQQLGSLLGFKYTVKDGVDIYRFTCLASPFSKDKFLKCQNLFYQVMAHKMNRVLRKMQYTPDIIIAHMPVGTINNYISLLNVKCPRIAVLHDGDLKKIFMDSSTVNDQMVRKLNCNFQAVYARSHSIYRRLEAKKILTNLKPEIISSGVPTYTKYCERNWSEWAKEQIKILFVGELIPRKGAGVVLSSLKNVDSSGISYKFFIIGEGPERDKLEKLTRELELENSVSFVGAVPRRKVYDYMAQSDIFVMPSAHETLGLVYLEAMQNGCITIGSKDEGIDGIIEDRYNGFLVEALNINELTKKLIEILGMSTDKLKDISEQARKTSAYYNLEDMSERYLEIVKKELYAMKSRFE